MRMTWPTVIGGFTLAACAGADGAQLQPSEVAMGQCFYGRDVNNFRIADAKTAYVSTRQGYVFQLSTAPGCLDAGTASISVAPFGGASSRTCVGEQARVTVGRHSAAPLPCIAQVAGPIADSNVSGLPGRDDRDGL